MGKKMLQYHQMPKFRNVILLLIISLLVTGCTMADIPLVGRFFEKPQAVVSKTEVSLEYWGMFEPEQVMQPLIDKYQEVNPKVKITYSERKFEDNLSRYKKTLLGRLKDSSGPGIFRMHSTWVSEFLSEISRNNSAITTEDFNTRFYPVATDQCTISNGGVVCVPLMYDGLAILYNKNMFTDAGVPVPTSWDEIKTASATLAQRNGKVLTRGGIALGTAGNVANSTDILGLMFVQSKVKIPDDLGSEAAVAALTYYVDYAKKDNVWSADMPYSTIAFATEKTAMMIGTSWQMLEILDLNPTLDFGVIELPQLETLDGGTTHETWASFWVESVSADLSQEEQVAAWDFLNWLSQPEQQMQLYSESSKYRKFGEIYSDISLKANLGGVSYLAPIVNQAGFAKTSIINDLSGNDEYANIIKQAIDAVNNGTLPLDALKTAKQNYINLQSRGN